MTTNWLEIAKRKWPDLVVGGSGRFAVYTPHSAFSKILLFETRDEAQAIILDPKRAHIVDLLTTGTVDLEKMRDPYDPEDARRERREKRV